MRRDELKTILMKISEFYPVYGLLGLNVFIERGLSWYDDYRILIRIDNVVANRFENFEEWIKSNELKWSCVRRGEESYMVIYSRSL